MICTLGDLLLDVIVGLDGPMAEDTDTYGRTRVGPGGQAANVAAWTGARRAGPVHRQAGRRPGRASCSRELGRRGVELAGPSGGRHGHGDLRRSTGRAADDADRPRRRPRLRAGRVRSGLAGRLRMAPCRRLQPRRVRPCARPRSPPPRWRRASASTSPRPRLSRGRRRGVPWRRSNALAPPRFRERGRSGTLRRDRDGDVRDQAGRAGARRGGRPSTTRDRPRSSTRQARATRSLQASCSAARSSG